MTRPSGQGRHRGVFVCSVLVVALGSCGEKTRETREVPVGTLSVRLRTEKNGIAYRLRAATFSVTPLDASTPTATISTETNPDALAELRTLAAGIYNVNLSAGWRFEKDTGSGFETVVAQLVSENPVPIGIVPGQVTPASFSFLTDGTVVAMGDGTLEVSIQTTDTSTFSVNQLAATAGATCARLGGVLRCWGDSDFGALGNGNKLAVTDPAAAGNVPVGGPVTQIGAGVSHFCAVLTGGAVRCWGRNFNGDLGYGNTNNIGDDETPASAGNVNVGAPVAQIYGAFDHTCALLTNGAVRCWGHGFFGQLGYSNSDDIGDDESPASAGNVNVGGAVAQLALGSTHTCALLTNGRVRCWGKSNEIGYGNINDIGDDESPASAGDVDVGGTVTQLAAGAFHTCALLTTGAVRCWGRGPNGQLGYGNIQLGGVPGTAGDVNIGGVAVQLAAGVHHTCALLTTGAVRCWGLGFNGRLGYGNTNDIGDDETPASAGSVAIGGPVARLFAGDDTTCALLKTGAVRCWGRAPAHGHPGLGAIGDDETPASAGDVVITSGPTTAQMTVSVVGSGTVSSNPGGISGCGAFGATCTTILPVNAIVTLTATPAATAAFIGWSGDCSGSAPTVTVTLTQSRLCNATFTTPSPTGVAPTFVAAGAGVDGTTSLAVPYPAGLQANDLLILQIGSRTPGCTPVTPPAGFSHVEPGELANPNAFQRLYSRFATGTETGSLLVTLAATANVAAGRMYAFRGVVVAGGGFADGATSNTGSNGTAPGPTLVTTGPGRLAVAFVSLDNNPAMEPYVGSSGGVWTEAVPAFGTALGSHFSLQLQIAPMPAAGTLSGGAANFGGGTDVSVCRAGALIGT